jgi:hypothetical protein
MTYINEDLTRVTPRVLLVEHILLALPDHMRSSTSFSAVCVLHFVLLHIRVVMSDSNM